MQIRNKKIKVFGLDISDSTIKVVELGMNKDRVFARAHADVPLSDRVINNHVIINQKGLADNITKALNVAKKIDTKFVICSVPEAKSFIRTMEIPKMEDKEIEGAIPFELEQDIPIPVDQVYLDWEILKETPDKLQILVTASSKDYIDALLETLRLAKLQPLVLEIGSQATARALIGPDNRDKNILITDIGARQTSFIIVDHGSPVYTSSIPIAGRVFTESIARSLSISMQAAEKLKLKSDLLSEMDPQQLEVRKAILPVLDQIIDELKTVMKFFEEHSTSQGRIGGVILCGGSSRIPGVLEYVTAKINLESRHPQTVSFGNPWANAYLTARPQVSANPGESLNYATAIGLAMRGFTYET